VRITTFDTEFEFKGKIEFEDAWNWLSKHFREPTLDCDLEQAKSCEFMAHLCMEVGEARSEAIVSLPFIPFSFVTVRKKVPKSLLITEINNHLTGEETEEQENEIRHCVTVDLLKQALPERSEVEAAWNIETGRIYLSTGGAGVIDDFMAVWMTNAKDEGPELKLRDYRRIVTTRLTENSLKYFNGMSPTNYGDVENCDGLDDEAKYDAGQDFLLWLIMKIEQESGGTYSDEIHGLDIELDDSASFTSFGSNRVTIKSENGGLTIEGETALKCGKKPAWCGFYVTVPGVNAEIKLDQSMVISAYKETDADKSVCDYASEELARKLSHFETVRAVLENVFVSWLDGWIDSEPQEELMNWLNPALTQ